MAGYDTTGNLARMVALHPTSRTHRSPDGVWATGGAINQHDGKLPIYVCNDCGREVVWATSKRTGRKYLANIAHGENGWRFYIGASIHRCPGREVDEADIDAQYEDWCASEYAAHIAAIVQAAWAERVQVGDVDRAAYYDTTTYSIHVSGVTAEQVRRVLAARDGQSMASYGACGGYSTIGRVTPTGVDEFIVESVYHIGD